MVGRVKFLDSIYYSIAESSMVLFETLVTNAVMARIEKKGSFVKINGKTVWFKAIMTTCTASYGTLS